MKNSRKSRIVRALRYKGFSKRAATNIAKATLNKSKEMNYVSDWSESLRGTMRLSSAAKTRNERLNAQAAIAKPSTMAGKIVVVPKG